MNYQIKHIQIPMSNGVMFPIKNMSISFLRNKIAYIRHTEKEIEYLADLEYQLKIKTLPIFKSLI